MADRVYLRAAPAPAGSLLGRDFARAWLLYAGVDPINLGSYEGQAYLLELAPFDASLTVSLPLPLPAGCIDRRTHRYLVSQGKAATIYPASTGDAARSTLPTDTPASTWVPGKLSGAFNYEINLFSGADPASGGSTSIGVLELEDPDGELDALRTLAWDGVPLKLRRGAPEALFSTFTTVANLSTAGIIYDTRKKQIKLRDLSWRLAQGELHGLRYLGTGAAEGDAPLTGQIKPYCIGKVFNISPVQVNATGLIYQVSCTSVLAIDAVRDGGAALAASVDYPDYATLAAATVASSTYATCLALGLFRLGSAPVFIITADVRGDNDTVNGTTYPSTRAEIARRIATGKGTVRVDDPTGIDNTAHQALAQRQTATLGYFWNSEMTKAAALNEVMAGCLGWWCVRLNGTLAYGQIEDPSSVAPLFSLTYPTDANDSEVRVGEPSMVDYPVRRQQTRVGWSRNYTPMQVNQIAGSVPQATSLIYQGASRFTSSGDLWIQSAYPTAIVQSIDGGFSLEADAQAEGDRQQRIFRDLREAFEIPVIMDPFADVVARVITINNSGRLGLGTSRRLFCSGIAVNGNAQPILRLWG